MSKLTITSSFIGTSQPNVHFLVSDQADARALTDLGFSSHVIGLPGGSLTDWTKGKGVAENQLADILRARHEVVLLLPRYIRENDKVKKMSDAFREFAKNVDVKYYNPQTEPGTPIVELVDYFADEIFTKIIANGYLLSGEPEEEEFTGEANSEDDAATVLYGLIHEAFTVARTADSSNLFLLPNEKAKLASRAYEIGSTELKHWMTRTYRQRTGKVLPTFAPGAVEATLEGEAVVSWNIYKLASRTFQNVSGDVWIDLGLDDAKAVLIKDKAWTVEESLPYETGTAFYRNGSILPIQRPTATPLFEARGMLEKHLLPYVNAKTEDWPLVVAWMINHMIPDHDSPILMLISASGAGKSTATAAVKYAVEGGLVLGTTAKFKDNEDDIMVSMSKSRVTMYDNVSSISAELSDTLCQVVYGTTYDKRKLRTDSDLVTLDINSSLILNGIETGHLRGDLKSRMVPVEMNDQLMDQMGAKTLKTRIVDAHPYIFGSLLTLLANVLPLLDDAPEFPSSGPKGMRMQDYARTLWALDQLWGTKGLDYYIQSLNLLSEDLLSDPFLMSVATLVRRHGTNVAEDGAYEGLIGADEILTTHESQSFLERYQAATRGKETLDSRTLGGKLTRAQNEWSRLGVTIKKEARTVLRGKRQQTYWFRITNKDLMDDVFQMQTVGGIK